MQTAEVSENEACIRPSTVEGLQSPSPWRARGISLDVKASTLNPNPKPQSLNPKPSPKPPKGLGYIGYLGFRVFRV